MTAKEIRAWEPRTDPDVMRNLEMLREIAAQLAEQNAMQREYLDFLKSNQQ